ncbi:MAG: biotin--[acetyl-CoA-carboxylase] ligase, partial [Staphylococcus epidermidis]|nr:biotin--[acetyl-CoA-carboxylase] ligase [Staphylococcus epidermidis]
TFLTTLLTQIIHRFDQFLHQTFESIREEYIHTTNIWHRQLKFTENDHQFLGEAIDIDSDGFLIVKDEEGQLHRLMSADIDL